MQLLKLEFTVYLSPTRPNRLVSIVVHGGYLVNAKKNKSKLAFRCETSFHSNKIIV